MRSLADREPIDSNDARDEVVPMRILISRVFGDCRVRIRRAKRLD
jgi:hypothetical protein